MGSAILKLNSLLAFSGWKGNPIVPDRIPG
jgi:hypothetical protein